MGYSSKVTFVSLGFHAHPLGISPVSLLLSSRREPATHRLPGAYTLRTGCLGPITLVAVLKTDEYHTIKAYPPTHTHNSTHIQISFLGFQQGHHTKLIIKLICTCSLGSAGTALPL